MQTVATALLIVLACFMNAPASQAMSATLDVTVTYRERIALPPAAQLEVQVLDVSRADTGTKRIASQRVSMTGVPQTVSLHYDPEIIESEARYAVWAAIWSGDQQLFRAVLRQDISPDLDGDAVDILLLRISDEALPDRPMTISGSIWTVTEVAGQPWRTDDAGTLSIDDEMNFSIFGGCNRFRGQLTVADNQIAFPQTFAGTLMACPDEKEALERRFLEALRKAQSFVRYGGGLVMMDAKGNALAHFIEHPE